MIKAHPSTLLEEHTQVHGKILNEHSAVPMGKRMTHHSDMEQTSLRIPKPNMRTMPIARAWTTHAHRVGLTRAAVPGYRVARSVLRDLSTT